MKRNLITIQFILLAGLIMAQTAATSDSFYTLKIEKMHKKPDSGSGKSDCTSKDFQILTNFLSDFTVNDRTYRYRLIVGGTADSLMIALPGDNNPVITISPRDIRSMNTVIWCYTHDSISGWQPFVFKSKEYTFSMMKTDHDHSVLHTRLCWDENCEPVYYGYRHCHPTLECRYIFKKDGEFYIYGEGDEETVRLEIEE